MKQKHEAQVPLMPSEGPQIAKLRRELHELLQEQVNALIIEEREAQLLAWRLGLIDGECATLQKAGELLQTSPEWIRQRQYFLLKRKINDPRFFSKLGEYSRVVALPRGIKIR